MEETSESMLPSYGGGLPTKKSGFPYLIDMSISTACPFACQFCYTSSTAKGKDADINYICDIIPPLAKANVLEIVLGGGEPTLAKHFLTICNTLRAYNFKIGVTTKNYKLHKHKEIQEIKRLVNSVAFSCNTIDELELMSKCTKAIYALPDYKIPKFYAQNILGLHSWDHMKEYLLAAKAMHINNVTLLGYKDFGFGTQVKPHEIPDEWVPFVKELNINIGIDSILAQKYSQLLIQNGVKHYMLVGAEGKSSCYIDAVNKQLKASSFTTDFISLYDVEKAGFDSDERWADYFLGEFQKL